MDFMKVLDQTVREIKREVNLKVLMVPEIEQKVLDATSDEPWGPHGSDLAEIARATKSYGECQMIMNVLWQRLGDTAANWRHVYKALAVIEYLLANGNERAVDDIIDNCSQIAKLTSFDYVEPSGKDVGLNVRKKAETVLAIIDDREKIQQVREKAAATRDKNQDSSNMTINGGLSQQNVSIEDEDDFDPRGSSSAGTTNANSDHVDLFGPSLLDDLDLVNITSTSTAMPNTGPFAVPEVDLFATTAFHSANAPLETANGSHAQISLHTYGTTRLHFTENIDLFAGRSSFAGSVISDTEFFVRGNPDKSSEQNLFFPANPSGSAFDLHYTKSKSLQEKSPTPEHSSAALFDPFAAIPMKSFDGSDSFGTFSSNTGSVPTEPKQNPPRGIKSSEHSPSEKLNSGAFTSQTESPTASAMKPINKSPTKLEPPSTSATKSDVKEGSFQVKSGIWADSLSRGLINLNIASPKKADLSDVGVVGRLSNGSSEKRYNGTTMGTGSGLGRSGFQSSAGTNSQQQQFARFN
ncbi:hypothetical protein PR202_ga09742 [Eleusine coracana subsp. coracana]|uniref:ENTH domain-containing protein n=1 Tax=Eleusine coracana subsp. coracana TaxID=191504 RepID=A0AAV5C3X0_ELECO|nr:hypothetical protein PR202_ga09742 [Eleusine coracana subsp. coracana]